MPFEGSYLPSSRSAEEAGVRGNPRPSLAERYASREQYLHRFGDALDELVRERWILPEDRAALLERGGEEWDSAMKGSSPQVR